MPGGVKDAGIVSLAHVHDGRYRVLPHILMRYFTTPTVRAARRSVGWSLFFIFLLYFTAPALATLTKLQFLDPNLATSIIGKPFADVST